MQARVISKEQHSMVDLHGLSTSHAFNEVIKNIHYAPGRNISRIRFVTGRGNHINKTGEQGLLYKQFENWLKTVEGKIHRTTKHNGFYEVFLKSGQENEISPLKVFNQWMIAWIIENLENIQLGAQNNESESAIVCLLLRTWMGY
jgi:hypothetical protein